MSVNDFNRAFHAEMTNLKKVLEIYIFFLKLWLFWLFSPEVCFSQDREVFIIQ